MPVLSGGGSSHEALPLSFAPGGDARNRPSDQGWMNGLEHRVSGRAATEEGCASRNYDKTEAVYDRL